MQSSQRKESNTLYQYQHLKESLVDLLFSSQYAPYRPGYQYFSLLVVIFLKSFRLSSGFSVSTIHPLIVLEIVECIWYPSFRKSFFFPSSPDIVPSNILIGLFFLPCRLRCWWIIFIKLWLVKYVSTWSPSLLLHSLQTEKVHKPLLPKVSGIICSFEKYFSYLVSAQQSLSQNHEQLWIPAERGYAASNSMKWMESDPLSLSAK